MRLGKLSLVLAAALVVAGTAAAQQPGGRGGFGGFGGGLSMMIGSNKQLQDELKVSKEQVDKLTEATAKVREELKDDLAKLLDRETTAADREKIMKQMTDANTKAVEGVLKPDQIKRLHQIENQQAGIGLFTKEESAAPLKLSDTQKDKIDDINKELQKDLRDLRGGGRGGFDPETTKKRTELQKGALENVRKLLSDKQKDTLKDLMGEPFELTFTAPGGGGPGGGRGGFGTPGQILAPFVQDQLKLSDEQKKKLAELQKDTETKLEKILSEEQQKQLKQLQQPGGGRGPGAPPQ